MHVIYTVAVQAHIIQGLSFTVDNERNPLRSLKKAGEVDMQCGEEGGAVCVFWGWGQESEQMAD